MPQQGIHTWDMHTAYHSCPECGFIQENRDPYKYKSAGIYIKDLECQRCQHRYRVERKSRLTMGPLLGEGQPAEITWD